MPSRFAACVVVAAATALALPACHRDRATPAEKAPPPTLRIVAVTDLDGYLEPCGCTSNPLGGIDRLAARVEELKGEGVPALFVAAGPLFFGPGHGGSPESATQDLWRAQLVASVLNRLGLAYAASGPSDLAQGARVYGELVARLGAHIVPAPRGGDATASAGAETQPAGLWFTRVGSTDVAVVAATEPGADAPAADTETKPAAAEEGEAAGAAAGGATGATPKREKTPPATIFDAAHFAAIGAAIAKREPRVVVALVRGSRAFAREVATATHATFVIEGGLDQPDPIPPTSIGDGSFLMNAGRQGQGVVELDVYLRKPGLGLADKSVWSQQGRADALDEEIGSLEARIEGWERSKDVNPSDLAAQKARLARMRAERDAIAKPIGVEANENAFVARYFPFPHSAATDPKVTALVDAYAVRVNQHNKVALAGLTPVPAKPGQPVYVGSDACRSCHEPAYLWWKGHPHGYAYSTLVKVHKEYNLDCVGCHVTGYMKPGGSTVTHNLGGALENVGCENCHGPGSAHVKDPSVPMARTDPPESVCLQCHTPEHSDRFNYEAYRRSLLVPGHGMAM
ncbi:MAG: hypothetical protein KC543_03205 [Myxococcales bacterium]|nr:hypothetical protein [Myxococcales bacterium]